MTPAKKNFISYLRHFTYSLNPQVYKITSPLIKAQTCDFEVGRGGGKGGGGGGVGKLCVIYKTTSAMRNTKTFRQILIVIKYRDYFCF